MGKVFKIIKINLLSLVALPLLLLATFFKLVAKAFEKITVFLVLTIIAIVVIALLATAPMPKNVGELILGIFLVALVLGLLFLFLGWILALISGVAVIIWDLIISCFDRLYDLTYTGYLSLYTTCENDYKILSINGRKIPNAIACLFFSILKGLSWLIVTIVSLSFPAAIIGSIGLVLFTLMDLNKNVKTSFGLNLIQYAGKSEVHSVIAGCLIYLVLIGIVITAIFALATEWFEWAQELKMTAQEISEEISDLVKSDIKMASGSSEEVERNLGYVKILEDHLDGLEPLGQQVTDLLDRKDNSLLRSYWSTYMRNLNPLIEECSNKKGVEINRFKQLIPQIQMLDRQRNDIRKLVAKLEAELQNPAGTSVFFAGCNTLEKLEKRYKSLCKTYHPDIAEGDTATFQKMKQEYESLKAELSANQKNS